MGRCFAGYDVVVCEGYAERRPTSSRCSATARATRHRSAPPDEPLALVTDADLEHEHRFGLDDAGALAAFIVERLGLLAHRAGRQRPKPRRGVRVSLHDGSSTSK